MAIYSIRDLEKLSGVKAHTIRIWEKRYGIINPKRTTTNIRYYSDDDLKKILNISILNRNGYKISKIAALNEEFIVDQVVNITKDVGNSNSQIESLMMTMFELDENKFERILARLILQLGFEETIINVIYPLFEKIGYLWQAGSINPLQEHFLSNLVRQKLIVAIDSQMGGENPAAKLFTLYLPEGEMHEIGLLFFCYLIKKKGHKVIYFGQSVPFKDILTTKKIYDSRYIVTLFSTSLTKLKIDNYLQNLSENFADQTIIISGSQVKNTDISKYPNIRKINSVVDFRNFINSI
ncbi:MAG: MerR family transcriptional regulator [Bacteroidia bacterium]|nr:MerR family transcriptional regulator [Bacteroidia bacterium]